MKKIFLGLLLGLATIGFSVQNASSGAFDNGGDGEVTITTNGVPTAAGSLLFNPSTGVAIYGASDVTSFAVAAYHSAVVGKKAGQGYGMAADSNKQWVLDIGPDGDADASEAQLVTADTNAATAFANPWVSI